MIVFIICIILIVLGIYIILKLKLPVDMQEELDSHDRMLKLGGKRFKREKFNVARIDEEFAEKEAFSKLKLYEVCMPAMDYYSNNGYNSIKLLYKNETLGYIPEKLKPIVRSNITSPTQKYWFIISNLCCDNDKYEIGIDFYYEDSKGFFSIKDENISLYKRIHEPSYYHKGYYSPTKEPRLPLGDYCYIELTNEYIERDYNHYGISQKENIDEIDWKIIQEDDYYLSLFVFEFYIQSIAFKKDRTAFIRRCTQERFLGDNKALGKRITEYLKLKDLFLYDNM